MAKAVEVTGVSQDYGQFKALDNVSLSIEDGETYGLLGPNGAGKSTLMTIISSLAAPTHGSIRVSGGQAAIGLAPQENSFYDELTVRENLEFFGRLYSVPGKEVRERAASTLAMLDLSDKANARADTLSGGMKRRLNIACALMHNPKLLILDEPSVGLDPFSRRILWNVVARLKNKGMTILITTHYMDEADSLCGRIAVLQKGRVVAEGTPAELKRRVQAEIRLSLTTPPTKADAKALSSDKLVAFESEGNNIIVRTTDPEKQLPILTRRFGKRLRSVEVKQPSLEDFFLMLTEEKK